MLADEMNMPADAPLRRGAASVEMAVQDHERALETARSLQRGAEDQTAHAVHERGVAEFGVSLMIKERNGLLHEVHRQEEAIQALQKGTAFEKLTKLIGEARLVKGGRVSQIRTEDWERIRAAVLDLRS